MNINDIDEEIQIPGSPWMAMYNSAVLRQAEYHKIERDIGYGLLESLEDFDLDDSKSQYLLKDFKWRITEELAEALEAQSEDNLEHYKEELIDALIFFMNLLALLKQPPVDIRESQNPIPELRSFLEVITWLGLAGNCLKNKPWKQSHMATDKKKYMKNITMAILVYQDFLVGTFGSLDEVYKAFYKKQKVNAFRTESNY